MAIQMAWTHIDILHTVGRSLEMKCGCLNGGILKCGHMRNFVFPKWVYYLHNEEHLSSTFPLLLFQTTAILWEYSTTQSTSLAPWIHRPHTWVYCWPVATNSNNLRLAASVPLLACPSASRILTTLMERRWLFSHPKHPTLIWWTRTVLHDGILER